MEKENSKKTINNLPPKGTYDWDAKEFKIREYIFKNFREVCQSFGYEEYLTPTFEKKEIYQLKSGEDVGGKELMTFEDKAGRNYALRPEMSPSIIRLISRIYAKEQKPIRYFSIANFFRNEKPQKGRNREFWQLNYDIFGSESIYADIEIIKIGIEIMFKFIPKEILEKKPFVTYINDRKIITNFLEKRIVVKENMTQVIRILDKKDKLPEEKFEERLKECKLNEKQIEEIKKFMNKEMTIDEIDNYVDKEVTKDIKKVFSELKKDGYSNWIKFKPNLIRGFDYYTGIVYEIFDQTNNYQRSIFGGGRYDNLGDIFGQNNLPAVGCAPGDEGMKIFLENLNLLKDIDENKTKSYYLPIIESNAREVLNNLAVKLRKEKNIVVQGLEKEPISKALSFANQKNISKVILIGENELKENTVVEKDMETGKQNVTKL